MFLDDWVPGLPYAVTQFVVFLCRNFQTVAFGIELPAVIAAAYAIRFNFAVDQVRPDRHVPVRRLKLPVGGHKRGLGDS